jgi:hypothetical protein
VVDSASLIAAEYRRYGLGPFLEILRELLAHAGSLEGLRGTRVLELGPRNKVGLMRFLLEVAHAEHIRGVGRMRIWPWTRNRAFVEEHVDDAYLLDHLRKVPSASYDIVYSRHVIEQHSIDPWVLLTSRRYWGQFAKGGFKDLGESYPSSCANVHAIFGEVFRIVKPGGPIVSQIAKTGNSGLDAAFLEGLGATSIRERSLGRRSSIVTVRR